MSALTALTASPDTWSRISRNLSAELFRSLLRSCCWISFYIKIRWFMGYESWKYGILRTWVFTKFRKTLGYSWDMIRKFWWFMQKKQWWVRIWRLNYPSKRLVFLTIENKPLCQLFVFGNGWTTNITHWGNIENNTQLRCQLVVEVSLLAPNATGTFEGSCFLPSFNFSHLLLGGSFNLFEKYPK